MNNEAPHSPSSRKYKLTLFCILLLTCGLLMVSVCPLISQIYSEFAGGLIGLLFVYCGGNVSNKWVLKKTENEKQNSSESEVEE